ncbi:phosphatase [Thorsellia anophelis]|uniref:Putative hydrolase n=1 Tax=Thorsellia anophelis DSM 18579 TaxID=1123402 RepID=A0A1H9ZHE3_9GAMM|nr:phosphatase [Thorsellia anophelis]SES81065.1 putative hydrolase [Thorsellia anophelis DSM 18579]
MFPVDLHMHTVASTHAYSTVHDYTKMAKERGLKLIAVTDHGPDSEDSPHYWHFINRCIWPRIMDGVGVLRGIEANIKNRQGDIDCTGRLLDSVDIVLAGLHESVLGTEDNKIINTDALINTISRGDVHIITHPGNPNFPIEINEVAKAAAHFNVALELNNSSFIHSRPGSEPNCIKVVESVLDNGGMLSLGSDSHIMYEVGDFTECERILAMTQFPIHQVLNHSVSSVLNFLASKNRDYSQYYQSVL